MEKGLYRFGQRMGQLIPRLTREIFKKETKGVDFGDVTFSQMVVLGLLKEKGALMMKEIAKNLSVTTSAATGLVGRMVNAGLLKRIYNPDDRRIISVDMTKKGGMAIERIVKKRAELMIKVFGKLSHNERDAYIGIVEKIYNILKSETK